MKYLVVGWSDLQKRIVFDSSRRDRGDQKERDFSASRGENPIRISKRRRARGGKKTINSQFKKTIRLEEGAADDRRRDLETKSGVSATFFRHIWREDPRFPAIAPAQKRKETRGLEKGHPPHRVANRKKGKGGETTHRYVGKLVLRQRQRVGMEKENRLRPYRTATTGDVGRGRKKKKGIWLGREKILYEKKMKDSERKRTATS